MCYVCQVGGALFDWSWFSQECSEGRSAVLCVNDVCSIYGPDSLLFVEVCVLPHQLDTICEEYLPVFFVYLLTPAVFSGQIFFTQGLYFSVLLFAGGCSI